MIEDFLLELSSGETWAIWVAVGFLGQAMFSMRFLIQWISSENQFPNYYALSMYLNHKSITKKS